MTDRNWIDLTSALAASDAAELRAEALDVLLAEGARSRLCDRVGTAVVHLVGGQVVRGDLRPSGVEDYLAVGDASGRSWLVRAASVELVLGSRATLRREGPGDQPQTVAGWLRQAQAVDAAIRAHVLTGRVVPGRLLFVGADHVELAADGAVVVVPFAAVCAWEWLD